MDRLFEKIASGSGQWGFARPDIVLWASKINPVHPPSSRLTMRAA
jgi:hypothetical protein